VNDVARAAQQSCAPVVVWAGNNRRHLAWPANKKENPVETRLARSKSDRIIGGVCGGLARYFGIDATIVRLVFVLAVLSGLSPLIYIILWIIMPLEGAPAPQANANLLTPPQADVDPTGEWRFDPYTGQPLKK